MIEMMMARPRPMNSGATGREASGLRGSVRANTKQARKALPIPSASMAVASETRWSASWLAPNMAGFGKYSPNTIADSSLPGPPLIR